MNLHKRPSWDIYLPRPQFCRSYTDCMQMYNWTLAIEHSVQSRYVIEAYTPLLIFNFNSMTFFISHQFTTDVISRHYTRKVFFPNQLNIHSKLFRDFLFKESYQISLSHWFAYVPHTCRLRVCKADSICICICWGSICICIQV